MNYYTIIGYGIIVCKLLCIKHLCRTGLLSMCMYNFGALYVSDIQLIVDYYTITGYGIIVCK